MSELAKASKLIQAAIDKGTFTPEALSRMNDALKRVDELERELERSTEKQKDTEKNYFDAKAKQAALEAKIAILTARESALAEREKEMHLIENNAARAQGEAFAYAKSFELVFRNYVVNRTVTSAVGTSTPGIPTATQPYPPSQFTNENKAETTTEESK